jgi:hypothetical protein
MLQKVCECREGDVEEWKQNWDEVSMDEVKRQRKGERERGKREKIKYHEMFRDRKG